LKNAQTNRNVQSRHLEGQLPVLHHLHWQAHRSQWTQMPLQQEAERTYENVRFDREAGTVPLKSFEHKSIILQCDTRTRDTDTKTAQYNTGIPAQGRRTTYSKQARITDHTKSKHDSRGTPHASAQHSVHAQSVAPARRSVSTAHYGSQARRKSRERASGTTLTGELPGCPALTGCCQRGG
jgi:hypothetical protein